MQSRGEFGPTRNAPLDAYRGLAVGGMAVVNLQDPFRPSVRLLTHAPWTGLTFADLVFPMFVLGVGLAVPLALDRAGSASWSRVVSRSIWLVVLGVALNWVLHPTPLAWPQVLNVRASGVLQRIGLVYFACAGWAKITRRASPALAAAAALMAVQAAVLLLVSAPGQAHPSLAPGEGVSAWLDRTLLPGRLPRSGYDPEGVLSSLSAVAEGLIGVAITRSARARAASNGAVLAWLAWVAAALIVSGAAMSALLPINKQLWTPSYALLTCGAGLAIWTALIRVWPRSGSDRGAAGAIGAVANALLLLGRGALTFYVMHMLLIAVLLQRVDDGRVWDVLTAGVAAFGLGDAFASLLLALALAAVCGLALQWLLRRGWALRL